MVKDVLTLSVVTFHAKWGDKKTNLNRIIGNIEVAANQGSKLIVFPEMALTGYDDQSEKPLHNKMQFKEAETIPGPSSEIIEHAAQKYGMYVIVGMPERDSNDQDKLYNSLAIFSPQGLVGSYRKIHLPDPEPNWAIRGEKPFIMDTPWGPIGCSICYDNYAFPELRRYYAAMGCRLSINSTALAQCHGKYLGSTTLESGVLQDGIYIASSNLGGVDLFNKFWGGASVIGPGQETWEPYYYVGKRFTDPGANESKIYTVTIDLSLATRYPYVYNPKVGGPDWRPELYIKMLQNVLEHNSKLKKKVTL
jgi:predicted amidohydrolase